MAAQLDIDLPPPLSATDSLGVYGVDMSDSGFRLRPVGRVESPLIDRALAPKQGNEGAPEASIVFESTATEAIDGIQAGDEVIVLTWLDRADREVLRTRPRDDPENPLQGVFNTRSPDRPDPIGLHPVEVISVDGATIRVRNLEALNGTPVIDVKAVI